MTHTYDIFETPLGWMGALASPGGVRRTTLPQSTPDECVALLGPEMASAAHIPGDLTHLRRALDAYFAGEVVTFTDVALDLDSAPPFLSAAWAVCRSIPYGETRSYKWLAAQAGSPLALRAAGQSMARNRIPIVIPCHRVLASNGALHGFGKDASQLDLKAKLLEIERRGRRA